MKKINSAKRRSYCKIFLILLITVLMETQAQNKNKMDSTIRMELNMLIDAPLETVWRAWSDTALIKEWWGPKGFTAPVVNINFKVGSTSLVCMRSPDGFEIYNSWTYTQILPMYSIEFIQYFTDAAGNKLNPSDLNLPQDIPEAVPHIIRFEDLGDGKTILTIIESGYESEQVAEISKSGMIQCLEKMKKLLAEEKVRTPERIVKKQINILTSAAKLWDVLTNPEMIKQWLSGSNVISDWRQGSPILFTGNWNGKEYEDRGVIMQYVQNKLFQFSYFSNFSGLPEIPENYSIIRFDITEYENEAILKLTHSNITTATMLEHSDKNWNEALNIIKTLAEK